VAQRNCTVYSPCLHEDSCPALFKVEDWCHEERPWRPPPWIVAIDEVVGFIKDALKFSYVILRRDGRTIVPRDAAAFRVVSELRVMKGDIRAWLCSEQGRSDIGRLDRDRSDVNQGLDAWHRGAIVRLTNVEWKPERKTGLHTGRVRKTSGAEVIRPVDGYSASGSEDPCLCFTLSSSNSSAISSASISRSSGTETIGIGFLGLGFGFESPSEDGLLWSASPIPHSIHQYRRRYSNDSNDDFSVKGCPHALHVTK